MDLEVYRRRLGGKNASEALVNASISQTKSLFAESPLYSSIILDGVEKGVRVNYEKEYERQLLLQPKEVSFKGAIAEFEGHKWLATEFIPHPVYPKLQVTLCNQKIAWNDENGVHEYPVIVRGKGYKLNETTDYMKVAEGDITVQIPYNNYTKEITETQRFVLNDRAYIVIGIDSITNVLNGIGNIDLTLELVSKSKSDDVVTNVAGNNSSGWGGGW